MFPHFVGVNHLAILVHIYLRRAPADNLPKFDKKQWLFLTIEASEGKEARGRFFCFLALVLSRSAQEARGRFCCFLALFFASKCCARSLGACFLVPDWCASAGLLPASVRCPQGAGNKKGSPATLGFLVSLTGRKQKSHPRFFVLPALQSVAPCISARVTLCFQPGFQVVPRLPRRDARVLTCTYLCFPDALLLWKQENRPSASGGKCTHLCFHDAFFSLEAREPSPCFMLRPLLPPCLAKREAEPRFGAQPL